MSIKHLTKIISAINRNEKKNAQIAIAIAAMIFNGVNIIESAINAVTIVPKIPVSKQFPYIHTHLSPLLPSKTDNMTNPISARIAIPIDTATAITANGMTPKKNKIPTAIPTNILIKAASKHPNNLSQHIILPPL